MRFVLARQQVHEMASPQTIEDKYKALGLDICSVDDKHVFDVGLDFTAEQWVDLMDVEGESLGACCATISEIRDKLAAALRNSRRISVHDLQEVIALLESHDCDTENIAELAYLKQLWETIKGDADCDKPRVRALDLSNLDEVISTLSSLTRTYDFHRIMPYAQDGLSDNAKRIALMRLLPVVKALYDHLSNAQVKQIEGYAFFVDGQPTHSYGLPNIFGTDEFPNGLKEHMGRGEVHRVVVDVNGLRING